MTAGRPRYNRSGTLIEGIHVWGELKPSLTADDVFERASKIVRWSVAQEIVTAWIITTPAAALIADQTSEYRVGDPGHGRQHRSGCNRGPTDRKLTGKNRHPKLF